MSSPAAASATAVPVIIASPAQIESIVTVILIVVSVLAVSARLATKWAVSRRFNYDDALAVAALVSWSLWPASTAITADTNRFAQ